MTWFRLGTGDPTPEHTGPKGLDRGPGIGNALSLVMHRMRFQGTGDVPGQGRLVGVAIRAHLAAAVATLDAQISAGPASLPRTTA